MAPAVPSSAVALLETRMTLFTVSPRVAAKAPPSLVSQRRRFAKSFAASPRVRAEEAVSPRFRVRPMLAASARYPAGQRPPTSASV